MLKGIMINPGEHRYPVDEKLSVCPLCQIPDLSAELYDTADAAP